MKHVFFNTALCALLSVFHYQVAAQKPQNGQAAFDNLSKLGANNTTGNSGINAIQVYDERYKGVKGTPFLQDEWAEGSIYMANQIFSGLALKYDIYKQQLWVKSNDKVMVVSGYDLSKFELLVFQEQPRTFSKLKSSSRDVFYEVLEEGTFTLLKLHEKTFQKANYEGAFTVNNKYDEFRYKHRYFVLTTEGNLHSLKLGKQAFNDIFKEKATEAWAAKKKAGAVLHDELSLKKLVREVNLLR